MVMSAATGPPLHQTRASAPASQMSPAEEHTYSAHRTKASPLCHCAGGLSAAPMRWRQRAAQAALITKPRGNVTPIINSQYIRVRPIVPGTRNPKGWMIVTRPRPSQASTSSWRSNTRRMSRIASCVELSFTNASERFTPFRLGVVMRMVMDFRMKNRRVKMNFQEFCQRRSRDSGAYHLWCLRLIVGPIALYSKRGRRCTGRRATFGSFRCSSWPERPFSSKAWKSLDALARFICCQSLHFGQFLRRCGRFTRAICALHRRIMPTFIGTGLVIAGLFNFLAGAPRSIGVIGRCTRGTGLCGDRYLVRSASWVAS